MQISKFKPICDWPTASADDQLTSFHFTTSFMELFLETVVTKSNYWRLCSYIHYRAAYLSLPPFHTTFNARAGSGVVRIDPLHFLAGCRRRRL